MIGSTVSHYQVERQLGRGGSGTVYLARDVRLGRSVALKLLGASPASPAEAWSVFRDEARAIAELNHPAIATLYDVDVFEEQPFLVLEYLAGATLAEQLRAGPLPSADILKIGRTLAEGLAEAHAHGIVHRDVKPGNILFTSHGSPKLVDFGLARIRPELLPPVGPDSTTADLVQPERIEGTLAYMSPEQLRRLTIDPRSDIYSLGVVLFEMAAGRRPFPATEAAELISAILRDPVPRLKDLRPDLPDPLRRLIESCLEKDPERRPQSAADLVAELDGIERGDQAALSPQQRSLAVLPLLDLSPERDQGYFCDGIAEELIAGLTRLRNLQVASRTSTFAFRDRDADIGTIGRQLGVDSVLEGSVRKAGRRVRISAQLIDVESGFHLWAERFDRELDDILAIQDEIAGAIVAALEIRLSPRERFAVASQRTRDARAYDYYLRGRSLYYQFRRASVEQALDMFTRASEIDPDYALAYTWMATCWCFRYLYTDRREESMERADATSLRALELDAELAEAHAARCQVASLLGRSEEAEQHFETAVQLDPRLFEAYYFYARDRFAAGDLERAARLFEMATLADPDDYQSPLLVAQIYESLGRRTDARAAQRRGVMTVEMRLRAWPDDVRALYCGANGLVALGDKERGLVWAERALQLEPDEPMVLYNIACIQSLAGRVEPALDLLERAVRAGLQQIGWIRNDSNLDPLREHPRFVALMRWLEGKIAPDTPA
jgi:serine/threonine protein kinase/tetratricopeptide (TPR) repeat protein